jgi:hypothetical protein
MFNMGAKRMMGIIIVLNKFSILVASWGYLSDTANANEILKILIQTSLDKNFTTARKSITKLVIFRSFVAKCCKMRII